MWSWTTMPNTPAAAFTSAVISMSAREGVGSPLGWLWTRISTVAPTSSARLTISRGYTGVWFSVASEACTSCIYDGYDAHHKGATQIFITAFGGRSLPASSGLAGATV